MALLKSREYELEIGSLSQPGTRIIKGLRIGFTIEKSENSDPNRSEIRLYNCANDTRTLLKKEDSFVRLKAGYKGESRLIFLGDVTRSTTTREGTEMVTKIEAGDGHAALTDATLNKSYKKQTPVSNVITDLLGSFKGLTQGAGVKAILSTITDFFTTGGTISGSSAEALNRLLPALGVQWSIQDGEIRFQKDFLSLENQIYIYTSNTGLVGSPQESKDGILFDVLLNGNLKPLSKVQINSQSVSGIFQITKLTHEGDNYGEEWVTKCEARAV